MSEISAYKYINKQLFLFPMLGVLCSTPVVYAQDSDVAVKQAKKSKYQLEEVLVQAQRRSQSVNDVPIAVTALSGDQIQNKGISDTRDLHGFVPGLIVSRSAQGAPVYTLRGVGFNDASAFATPTTAVYIDEVNMPYSIMTKGAIMDIRQLEVLKGPQGTMFGRSTTGGAINYYANLPGEEFEAGFNATYSRFETYDVDAYLGGPITENLGYRIAARVLESKEGWQYSNIDKIEGREPRTLGVKDQTAFRGTLVWDMSDEVSWTAAYTEWTDNGDAQAGQPIALIPQSAFANPENLPGSDVLLTETETNNYPLVPQNTNNNRVAEWCTGHESCVDQNGVPLDFGVNEKFQQGSIKVRWDWSPKMTANFLASYAKFTSDDSQFPQGAYYKRHAEVATDIVMEVVDLEFRVSGVNDAETINWLVGIHSTPMDDTESVLQIYQSGDGTVILSIPGFNQTAVFGTDYFSPADTEFNSIAPYANMDWQFSEEFSLTLGVRYTEEERSYSGCSGAREEGNAINLVFQALAARRALETGNQPGVLEPNSGDSENCFSVSEEGDIGPYVETIEENSLSVRSVINWMPNDEYMFYGSLTRGFKSGSFPVFQTADHRQLKAVTQERVDAFELGAKLDFFDNMFHINMAGFYYLYKDKQLLSRFFDEVYGALPALTNAPKSEVKGFEFDITTSPIEGLFFTAAAAYVVAEVTDFKDAYSTSGEQIDLSGAPFNYTPNLTYTLTAEYVMPVFGSYEMGAGLDHTYTGSTNSTLEEHPVYHHRAYDITNARIRFGADDQSWNVSLWGRNIMNSFITNSVDSAVGDFKFRFTGMPQTYGISFNYKYF
ncbi:TonB-dependent receptor [Zhongshania sp.]|jgi:outer membrane receptor protein involved in Fe transport|uniref:TonB-dependent receptor n=1 Tax=Zhongshania sp. TaxID=1971902 RepID=UPI002A8276CF|nr:TonB-dependent receptor [Zhongshania sp.]